MKNRAAVLRFVLALSLSPVALAFAAASTITTTGIVVSKGKDSLVVRIDDHGHHIPFAIDGRTVLADGLKKGSRVRVVYHPTGSTGQTADEVVLLEAHAATARR
ncbi:MAG TPA: hypothetical protein VMT70_08800 [Vicinamibacteria bacterium]|nr:hypothetical protein [Vicinamibacteria bacterium]